MEGVLSLPLKILQYELYHIVRKTVKQFANLIPIELLDKTNLEYEIENYN